MLKKFHPTETPYRYVFKDPDTGYEFKASTMARLVQHIITYRVQNQLPLIDKLNLVIENYLCGLPENVGKCMPAEKLKRGWLTTFRGGIALVKNYFFDETVSQAVAEERAQICIKCPYNVFPDKDGFIAWSDKMAENMVGDKKVSVQEKLGNCEVCTCVLKGKVWYGGKIKLEPEQVKKMKQVGCWQVREDERK